MCARPRCFAGESVRRGGPRRTLALTIGGMLRLFGIPVAEPDARRLVASLVAEADPDALSAAAIIANGLDRQLAAVALTAEQRRAILAQLEDPPPGLAELRGALVRDHDHRRAWRGSPRPLTSRSPERQRQAAPGLVGVCLDLSSDSLEIGLRPSVLTFRGSGECQKRALRERAHVADHHGGLERARKTSVGFRLQYLSRRGGLFHVGGRQKHRTLDLQKPSSL
jgi:hypothetical protein